MFWVLRRSIFSDKAAAFFNALNNNNNNNNNYSNNNTNGNSTSAGNSKINNLKNIGYNKLSSYDDYILDEQNGNIETNDAKSIIGKLNTVLDANTTSDFDEELTDESDYDESLTCNVCDRSFYNRKMLEQHQQKKRHFGCSACDTLFPSIMQLEHHKEEFDHWSDTETSALTCHHHHHHYYHHRHHHSDHNCHEDDDEDDDFDDEDSYLESGEEMERLL